MATDIKISELNEVSCNNPLNHIIINDRESASDDGITKKITLENFFTTGIVKENAIAEGAITTSKLGSLSVDRTKIANNTITCNQILDGTICRNLLTPNIITNNELHNDCNYVVAGLHVTNNCLRVSDPVDGCLQVDSGRTQLGTIIYGWPTSQTAGYFLKTDGSGGLSWEAPSESTASSLVFTEIMPVGTIVPWSGAGSSVPNDKWLVCNGTTFSSDDYPELAAVLGDTYGTHTGTTYYLPNYQGRVPIGSGTTQDTNDNSETFTVGSRGGEFTHQLTCTEMPTHNHDNGQFNSLVTINGTGTTKGVDNTPNEINVLCGGTIQQAGGNGFHNNVQPYIGTSYIIKAKKDDIQQFNPTLGKGLSAIDSSGQTATLELSSTEIGVKIDNNTLRFDGSNSIELNPALSASSIKFNDGTIQTTYEKTPFYTVEVGDKKDLSTPSEFTSDQVLSIHDEFSKGSIMTGGNNRRHAAFNSLLYTMNVNVLSDTTITMKLYRLDDHLYVYVDGVLQTSETNYSKQVPIDVSFNLTAGNRKIEIVKNDAGLGDNGIDLVGNIISSNVLFLSGK